MRSAALAIEGLAKNFGLTVFDKLTFAVQPGEALSIVGPSGCGKSTLLHILAGLTAADQGQISLKPPTAGVALMLQHYGLFPWKTASQNLELPLQLRGLNASSRLEKVWAMLDELDLIECAKYYPNQLSGGQQQRLALGRALIAEPDLLLLDEPFSSIDAISRENLQNLLMSLWRKYGVSYILTTHSIEEAVFLGGRILVMGRSSSGFVGDFNNPVFGRAGARLEDEYFNLIKKVRLSLDAAISRGKGEI